MRVLATGLLLSRCASTHAFSTQPMSAAGAMYHIDERPIDEAELARTVRRHVADEAKWLAQRPVAAHTRAAFDAFRSAASASGKPIIVDTGCGAMRSTLRLALRHPDHLVVGVDRSAARLEKPGDQMPSNALALRAELGDFWRLVAEAPGEFDIRHTYALYPNPYPKREHLGKRWHGHPCFPLMLQATGSGGLTLRGSWKTYLDEFAFSVQVAADEGHAGARRLLLAGETDPEVSAPAEVSTPAELATPAWLAPATTLVDHLTASPLTQDGLTHFEAKYILAGTPTYQLRLGPRGAL
ncbi:hypothetical protein M885DRAFT_517241 [Pelagophyceae sp. CCMP2097]|nr:hypothetical protein M885DRAFT_517241 [Pelagophyceae sp. CCMP2097]|mmetsp:Transcript_9785/g.32223  ORF Transcript_9785/g.32223 Transcript_9785/m.32223 type:complete len:297 (+) Transcript_9785:155-1045(+)